MMILTDPHHHRLNPTVKIPLWDVEDPTAYDNAFAALQRYLPSNKNDGEDHDDFDVTVDAFSCDNFRMFEFKVTKCARARSHDWTECPFAHAGEKARRRDPRKYHYTGSACADFRRGACGRGDACEYAHGVFECWLHPSRYRTQPCKDGTHCRRRVCFFAHTAEQIRVDGYAGRDPFSAFGSSPKSTLYSPPSSPTESMGGVQVNKVKMGLGLGLSVSPPSWGLGFGSPRSPLMVRPGFVGLSSTPGRVVSGSGLGVFDKWEVSCEEEPMMERVESGRELREQIYEKLSRENSLDRVGRV